MAKSGSLGVRLLAAAGVVVAATGAVVGVSYLTSSSGDEPGLFGTVPTTVSPAVSEAAPRGIDYNCGLPGRGFPWLDVKPWEPPEEVGDDPPALMAERPVILGATVGGAGYELAMPLPPEGPSGGVDFATLYGTLCTMHPDLGGTGARPLTPDEIGMLADLGVTVGRESPGGIFGDCMCRIHPDVLAADAGKDLYCIPTDESPYVRCPGDWFWQMADPRHGCEQGGLECHEVDASEWKDVYTDAPLPHDGQPMRVFWLPPLPEDLKQELSREGDAEAGPEGDAEDQEGDLTQRWRVELSGEETVKYLPVTWEATGLQMAVGIEYELRGEFTVKRVDGEWLFVTGRITETSVIPEATYLPEEAWKVDEVACLNCGAIPATGNLDGVLYNNGELWLGWGPITPTVRIDARYPPCTPVDSCAADQPVSIRLTGTSFSGQVNTYPLMLTDDLQDGQEWPAVTFLYKLELLETYEPADP